MCNLTYPPVDNGEARNVLIPPPKCQGCDDAIREPNTLLIPHVLTFADRSQCIAYYCIDCSWVACHADMRDPMIVNALVIT